MFIFRCASGKFLTEEPEEVDLEKDNRKDIPLPKKRRKSYYIPVNSLPRILKRDIRREYGTMIINVFNSGDPELLEHFYTQFSFPHLQEVVNKKNARDQFHPKLKMGCGVHASVSRWMKIYTLMPDLILQLQDSQIIRRKDLTGCMLKLKIQLFSNKLYTENYNITLNDDIWSIHQACMHYYGLNECNQEEAWVESGSTIDELCKEYQKDDNKIQQQAYHDVIQNQSLMLVPCWICHTRYRKYLHPPKDTNLLLMLEVYLDHEHRIYRTEMSFMGGV